MKLEMELMMKNIQKGRSDLGLILPALLAMKELSIVYYTLSGEAIYMMGDHIAETDLSLSGDIRSELADGKIKQKKEWYQRENETFDITYCVVTDSLGKPHGFLKIKENGSPLKDKTRDDNENQKLMNTFAGGNNPKEARKIDSEQNIAELFQMYPQFKKDFFLLDEELKGLQGPLGMGLLKDSTVDMIARSLRINPDNLVRRINEMLERY